MGCVQFSDFNDTVSDYLDNDVFKSVKPLFRIIIDNYKVMLYNGQLDIIVPVTVTQNFLRNLGLIKVYSLKNTNQSKSIL